MAEYHSSKETLEKVVDNVENNSENKLISTDETELFSPYSKVDINRQNATHNMPLNGDSNDVDSDDPSCSSLSSSSSSSSTSYWQEFARQLIASYPTEDELAEIISENYFNHVSELLHEHSITEAANANAADNQIHLKSTEVQVNISFEPKQEEEEEDQE